MSSHFLPFYHVLLFQVYFPQTTSHFWQFLATSGLFQGIPGYSRLMFRHFRQYLIISCYFHPVTFMSVYFPSIPIHLRPFVVIFRLFQAFSGNYSLFQAFTGYSRLFPDIPGHFNLYQSIQSIQPNSIFFLHWLWLCVSEAVHEKGCFPLESQAIWELAVRNRCEI